MEEREILKEVRDRLDRILSAGDYVPNHLNIYMTKQEAIIIKELLTNKLNNDNKHDNNTTT